MSDPFSFDDEPDFVPAPAMREGGIAARADRRVVRAAKHHENPIDRRKTPHPIRQRPNPALESNRYAASPTSDHSSPYYSFSLSRYQELQ